ncbi:MAG: serine acetyltransferase [Myxococcus sp.]|nr:serine acetyltransferase [Myxococcus sp.]
MSTLPQELIERLITERRKHRVPTQLRPLAQQFVQQCLGVLFPHFAPMVVCSEEAVTEDLIELEESLRRLERSVGALHEAMPERLAERFFAGLTAVHQRLSDDAQAIFEGDPAARSVDEVLLTYPGFFAIAVFRTANLLHRLGTPLLPRLLTEVAHEKTGIDIHPGATIGRRFCIDHGTGIVIGETTHIGDGVKLYQGVTLGALTVEKTLADAKRHPTIGDEVVIYAGATILGGQTTVGHHSIIAGNAFVTSSVPANSVVTRKNDVRPRGNNPSMFDDVDFVI